MNSHGKRNGRHTHACQAQPVAPRQPEAATDAQKTAVPLSDPAPAGSTPLEKELAALKDNCLRLGADFDNFRKRTRRDSGREAAAEKEAFIVDLLPVLDNLERALVSAPAIASGALHQGVTMTLQQLNQLLDRHGIKAADDVGCLFDTHRHEAVFMRRDSSKPDHTVLEVMQRGYCRGEHVLRPAKVVVNDWSPSADAS